MQGQHGPQKKNQTQRFSLSRMLGKQFKAQAFSNDIAWAINYPTWTTCFVAWVNEIMNVRKKGNKTRGQDNIIRTHINFTPRSEQK